LVLTVIREILTLLAILHLEIAKNLFAAGSAEQLNSPLVSLLTAVKTSLRKQRNRKLPIQTYKEFF